MSHKWPLIINQNVALYKLFWRINLNRQSLEALQHQLGVA